MSIRWKAWKGKKNYGCMNRKEKSNHGEDDGTNFANEKHDYKRRALQIDDREGEGASIHGGEVLCIQRCATP